MLDWDSWSTILAVAREGTISSAAKHLNLDPTTVNRRIKALEARLGAKLFFRERREHLPTSRCKEILLHLEQAAASIEAAQNVGSAIDASNRFMRTLRIAAPPFFIDRLIAPKVVQLIRRRKIKVEVLRSTGQNALIRGDVDLELIVDDLPDGMKWDKKRVRADVIGELRYRVYQHRSKDYDALPWAGLPERPEIRTGSALMDKLAQKRGLHIQVPNFEALSEVIASGAAKGLLPEHAARNKGTLVASSDVLLTQPIFLLSKSAATDNEFLNDCKRWIEATLV